MIDFTFNVPADIVFGCGKIKEIGKYASDMGHNALLATGRKSLRQSGCLDIILKSFSDSGVGVVIHDRIPPEPTIDDVSAVIDTCVRSNCDIVVAVGGGSTIDVAKAAAAICGKSGSVRDYLSGMKIEGRGLPLIAAPTTAGTGSEVTPNAVLIDADNTLKSSIHSKYMIPNCAIVDPEMLLPLPANETAYSGMDALTQAIEAYVSIKSTPLTDVIAVRAALYMMDNLIRAYQRGDDIQARYNTALGSLMGGIAFGNAKLGLVHGLAHPIGVLSHLPHGLVCGLLLPIVMEFNLQAAGEKYAALSRYMSIASSNDSDDTACMKLINAIKSMNSVIKLDRYMPQLAPDKSKWNLVVTQTLASGSTKSNPRKVESADVLAILEIIS